MVNDRFHMGGYLVHSAKGKEWKNHKYVRKEFKNGKYYYYYGSGNKNDKDGFDHVGTEKDADDYFYSEYLKGNLSRSEMEQAQQQIKDSSFDNTYSYGTWNHLEKDRAAREEVDKRRKTTP